MANEDLNVDTMLLVMERTHKVIGFALWAFGAKGFESEQKPTEADRAGALEDLERQYRTLHGYR